jgi:16S rRNA (uracil1498-N3)-methyltransferase
MQPGDAVTLFNNGPGWEHSIGGEFSATVTQMGRSHVQVCIDSHRGVERENACKVHLAVGMPANDRMDWLVEKATEIGVTSIQPLMTERSVLRLAGERAEKKVAHWQSTAVAACEQCGGNRVPTVFAPATLAQWMKAGLNDFEGNPARRLLSLREGALALGRNGTTGFDAPAGVIFMSGPEGGLSAAEEDAAVANGFVPVSLGKRVLRAETAALAALTLLSMMG